MTAQRDRLGPHAALAGPVPTWRRWLPRVGALATLITTVCCIGVPAAVSLATALGATFLLHDSSLKPLLVAVLLVTVGGSALTFWRHRNPIPLMVTGLAGVSLYWFIFHDYRVSAVWIAAAALIAAQVWDVLAVQACGMGRGTHASITSTTGESASDGIGARRRASHQKEAPLGQDRDTNPQERVATVARPGDISDE